MAAQLFAIFFISALAAANAGLIAAPIARIIQGPSASSTIIGPDGSSISSVAPGGRIIAEEGLGVAAYGLPAVAAAPLVAPYSAPLVARAAYAAPFAGGYADTVIAGPSGTIATSKTLAGPAFLPAAYSGFYY